VRRSAGVQAFLSENRLEFDRKQLSSSKQVFYAGPAIVSNFSHLSLDRDFLHPI
jgi:hypothetical protein